MTASVSHCRMRARQLPAGTLLFAVLLGSAAAEPPGGKVEVTADRYQIARETHGVVVMGVDWSRLWNFCGFENVQLRTFAFDRVPVQKRSDKDAADLVLTPPPSLLAGPGTIARYALLVEPGEYALSYTELKMARSVNKVDSYALGRKKLIADGNSRAGSFTVAAGEIVYVGDFAPECVDGEARIWRYHVVGRAGFKEYLARNVKSKYPFLDTESVQYRLFKTSVIGNDYELQCYFPSSAEKVESGNIIYDGEDCVSN